MNGMIKLLGAVLLAGTMGTVYAKLPVEPVDPAKAEAAKMKKAEAAKKGAEALAKAQDRAVANYKHSKAGVMPVKTEMMPALHKSKK